MNQRERTYFASSSRTWVQNVNVQAETSKGASDMRDKSRDISCVRSGVAANAAGSHRYGMYVLPACTYANASTLQT